MGSVALWWRRWAAGEAGEAVSPVARGEEAGGRHEKKAWE